MISQHEGTSLPPDRRESRTVTREDIAANDKRFSNARAKLALKNFALHILDEDGRAVFLIQRWDRSMVVPSLDEVEALMQRLGIA